MSTDPLINNIAHSQMSSERRLIQPSLSSQYAFSDCLQTVVREIESELQQAFEQEDEAQRHQRQQIILQALNRPGGLYRDSWRLIHRDDGISLSWQLINGPLGGLMIKAVLVAGELQLRLLVSDWLHYRCLLANKPRWLTVLNHGVYRVSIEVLHVVSST